MSNNKNKNEKDKKNETFLKLYPKLMARPDLTLLKKILISDAISFQRSGRIYYKPSSTVAQSLGTYKPRTISNAFQELERDGFINTKPYNDGSHQNDLRQVEVVQLDQYIYTDEHLENIGFKLLPLVKKSKDQLSHWKTQRAKAKKKAQSASIEVAAPILPEAGELAETPAENITTAQVKAMPQPAALISGLPIGLKKPIPIDGDNEYTIQSKTKFYMDYSKLVELEHPTYKDFERFANAISPHSIVDENCLVLIWNKMERNEKSRVSNKVLANVCQYLPQPNVQVN